MQAWKRFRLGDFLVETSDRTVRSNGTIHSLTPKEFEVLLLLAERCGQVVEKEEILAKIWPDAHVSEGNLTQYIYRLRALLGDDAIQTVPKRGYRLTVFVAEDAEQQAPAAAKPGPRRSWMWVAAGIAVVVLAAGWRVRSFRPNAEAYDLFLRGQARLQASLNSRSNAQPADDRRDAISFFRKAVDIDPRYADAYGALAETLCVANVRGYDSDQLLKEAEANAQLALRYDTRNLSARTALICVAHARGRHDEALRIAVEIEEMRSQSAAASFAAGEAFLRAGLAQRAVGQLSLAVEKLPQRVSYREQLAYALMLSGRPAECVATLSPALKKEEGGYWYAMNCLKQLARFGEAIAYGEKLVSLDPESPTAYRGLALSYRAAGREEEARATLTKAILHFEGVQETAPNARNASFLALMNAHLGNREDAVRWVNATLALDPGNSYLLYQCGVAYGILGDDDAAIELLKRAVERGFALKYYFDWQIRPEMGVPTLTGKERYRELESRLQKRVDDLENSLRSAKPRPRFEKILLGVRRQFPF